MASVGKAAKQRQAQIHPEQSEALQLERQLRASKHIVDNLKQQVVAHQANIEALDAEADELYYDLEAERRTARKYRVASVLLTIGLVASAVLAGYPLTQQLVA